MAALRYMLMIATMTLLGIIGYMFAAKGPPTQSSEKAMVTAVVVGLILNLVYLYGSGPASGDAKESRLARLGRLWLDAKERELKDRAGRS